MSGLPVVAALAVFFTFMCVWPALVSAGRADRIQEEDQP